MNDRRDKDGTAGAREAPLIVPSLSAALSDALEAHVAAARFEASMAVAGSGQSPRRVAAVDLAAPLRLHAHATACRWAVARVTLAATHATENSLTLAEARRDGRVAANLRGGDPSRLNLEALAELLCLRASEASRGAHPVPRDSEPRASLEPQTVSQGRALTRVAVTAEWDRQTGQVRVRVESA